MLDKQKREPVFNSRVCAREASNMYCFAMAKRSACSLSVTVFYSDGAVLGQKSGSATKKFCQERFCQGILSGKVFLGKRTARKKFCQEGFVRSSPGRNFVRTPNSKADSPFLAEPAS